MKTPRPSSLLKVIILMIGSKDCDDDDDENDDSVNDKDNVDDCDHEDPPALLPLEGEGEAGGVNRTMHLCHRHCFDHHFNFVNIILIIIPNYHNDHSHDKLNFCHLSVHLTVANQSTILIFG